MAKTTQVRASMPSIMPTGRQGYRHIGTMRMADTEGVFPDINWFIGSSLVSSIRLVQYVDKTVQVQILIPSSVNNKKVYYTTTSHKVNRSSGAPSNYSVEGFSYMTAGNGSVSDSNPIVSLGANGISKISVTAAEFNNPTNFENYDILVASVGTDRCAVFLRSNK